MPRRLGLHAGTNLQLQVKKNASVDLLCTYFVVLISAFADLGRAVVEVVRKASFSSCTRREMAS